MPTFDGSSSTANRAEVDLLRAVLGPARARETTLRAASRACHRSRRRSMLQRAILVVVVLGSVVGSAVLMSWANPTPAAVATGILRDPNATGSIAPSRRDRDKLRPEHTPNRQPD